jgi:hypothetical protein
LNQLKNSVLPLAPLSLPVDTAAQNQRTVMSGQHITTANSTFSTMHNNASNTAQRDNLISQPSTQVTFLPPLTSDTELLQVNNDNAITGTQNCYFSSVPLLKYSIPLGFNVNEKHRSLICGTCMLILLLYYLPTKTMKTK